jgi:hypothetical protein
MYRPEFQILLSSFAPVKLEDMDGVRLMDRMETKYVFCINKIPELLSLLATFYRVVQIEKMRDFPYCSIYMDTPEYMFYTQQVTGKLNRYKIRYRRYESTGVSFLEIKQKTNKNRTLKWRMASSPEQNDVIISSFLKEYMPYSTPDLQPVLINNFNRITFVGIESAERITLDYNLSFSSPDGKYCELPFLSIAEIKREKVNSHTTFGTAMKQLGIRPTGFSKYCLGNALLNNTPRRNILKKKLLLINKIENEFIKFSGS